ncbi:hypothetical protein [Nonomuraea sp. NPDC002799]
MRQLASAALLTAWTLAGTQPAAAAPAVPAAVPAAAVPAWVTDDECTEDGGKVVPVGNGKAICEGGTWDSKLIHFTHAPARPAGQAPATSLFGGLIEQLTR